MIIPKYKITILLIFSFSVFSAPDSFAGNLKGSVSGETYTSPRGLFRVRMQKPLNWARAPYVIQEAVQQGGPDFELVAFYVKDFAEVLIASVRHIPEVALGEMAKEDHRTTLSNLAYKALYDWRDNFPVEPTVINDEFFQTPYGESILRTYHAKQGSILEKPSGGENPEPKTFDVFIGVLLSKSGNKYIYAIAENDYLTEGGKSRERLEELLKEFYSGLDIIR